MLKNEQREQLIKDLEILLDGVVKTFMKETIMVYYDRAYRVGFMDGIEYYSKKGEESNEVS